MARRIRHTLILPPPYDPITSARAVRWLRHDFRRWAALAVTGAEPFFDRPTRRALGGLMLDLVAIVEACALAVETRAPVRMRLAQLPPREAERRASELARIVAADALLRERGIHTGLADKLRRAARRSR